MERFHGQLKIISGEVTFTYLCVVIGPVLYVRVKLGKLHTNIITIKILLARVFPSYKYSIHKEISIVHSVGASSQCY